MSEVRREVLPIPDTKHVGVTTFVATDPDTSYPPIAPLRPPAGAPNVLVVLLDDVGFGASSAFGGPCATPTAERLAAGGLKYSRFNPEMAGRPNPVAGTTQLLFGGMHRLQENVVINTKNKSHAITAEIEVPSDGAAGVIAAQGGSTGGWSLYAHEGALRYAYNFTGARMYYVSSDTPLPTGTHQVRMEFAYDGGGIGKGGDITLYIDGDQVGEGRVERTHWGIFSMDETTEVGSDAGAPVSEDYGPSDNAFTGRVSWVQLDIDAAAEDVDHLISEEERFRVAIAKQ